MSCQSPLVELSADFVATAVVAATMARKDSPSNTTVRPSNDIGTMDVDVDDDWLDLDSIPNTVLPAIQQAIKHEKAVP